MSDRDILLGSGGAPLGGFNPEATGGSGGGGGVASVAAGPGISAATPTVSNAGVISVSAGTGISVSGPAATPTVALTGSVVTSIAVAGNLAVSGGGVGAVTLSGPDTGTRVTAVTGVNALTLATVLGDTDGGYEIDGFITSSGGGTPQYALYFNGASAGASAAQYQSLAGGLPSFGPGAAGLTIGFNAVAFDIENAAFRIRIGSKQGEFQYYECTSYIHKPGGVETIGYRFYVTGYFKTTTQITSISVVETTGGNQITTGSWMRVRKIGFTA